MDRRSWLWRRKSSPSESSGTSISSPSERISDEQLNSSHGKNSPEITSKPATNEEQTEKVKTLTEKLSDALLTINAKEELVKQHAKVAEEAVTGWEKAEREVSGLKLQLDATLNKNSALEERVSHLENQLAELSSQLKWAKSEAVDSIDETKKENKFLRLELGALSRKLEVMSIERDLSTKAAESASKQRLESIKKVAKLEAECRMLRSKSGKGSVFDNPAQIKISDAELRKADLRAYSDEINLMDDFLEMEMLAALAEKENGNVLQNALKSDLEDKIEKLESDKGRLERELSESKLQLKDTKNRLLELESRLKTELMRVQNELIECQDQLRMSQSKLNASENVLIQLQTQLIEHKEQIDLSKIHLEELKMKLMERENKIEESQEKVREMQKQLSDYLEKMKASEVQIQDANNVIADLQAQLASVDKLKQDFERELQAKTTERDELRSEKRSLLARINSLVDEADKERALFAKAMAKCQRLEDELSKRVLQIEPQFQFPVGIMAEQKAEQERGLAMAAGKLEDCQKTIASLGKQLKLLVTFDEFLMDSDNPLEFSKESSVFFRTNGLEKVPCVDCQ